MAVGLQESPAWREGRISVRRVTITELLISSLGLLSGPFSHFMNELSLGHLRGRPACAHL